MPSSPVGRGDAVHREEDQAYPMPEDPPQYNDDNGLQCLNVGTRAWNDADCLTDGVGGDDITVKKGDTKECVDELSDAFVEDDYKDSPHAAWEDPFTVERRRNMQARSDRVEQRRRPENALGRVTQSVIPYGGVLSTAFNLASSTIGAGIIAMPKGFETSGLVMSVLYLVIVGLLTVYSFLLLTTVAEKTGIYSWEHIARRVVGPGVDYLVVFVMWVLCFGGDVSYVLSLKQVLEAFLRNSESVSPYLKTDNGSRVITSVVWFCVMLPLCLPKEINSLRYFSAIAITLVVFFVICVVVYGSKALHENGVRDDLVMLQTGNAAVLGLGTYLFGYIAQVNVFHTLQEAHKPSIRYMFWAALLGVGTCFMLYFLSGFFGYMSFGSEVEDTILPLYNPLEEPVFAVSYVGLALKLCVGFALHLIPCRDAVYYVIGTEVDRVPWWLNAVVSTIQATAALVAGLFIPRVTTVFGLLGGFCGSFIGFIFPALFMMYCGGFALHRVGWFHFFATYFMLIVGVIGVVFGTGATIFATIST